ncbi:MAG: ADP-ribosyltransferase, partial [Dysgonamonadaceae bacterium]|nr:ADP-ribosyltransferase [Dysgonamonadaceae bacterium]
IFTDKAFLSTAIHKDHGFTNKRINMVIAVPKGARGIYAEPFSHYTDYSKFNYNGIIWDGITKEDIRSEVEWIGQKGSMFKVIRVEMFTIYLEIIGQLQ